MKRCPYCSEKIQDRANKCRFCGEWLNKEKEATENCERGRDSSEVNKECDRIKARSEEIQNRFLETVIDDSRERFFIDRERALRLLATDAAFNRMLQRCVNLSNFELMTLISALKSCGQTSDDSGNLLPLLFYELYNMTQTARYGSSSFLDICGVFGFPLADSYIGGRTIRADALDRFAFHIRKTYCESPEQARQTLLEIRDPGVYVHLKSLCEEMRSLIRAKQRTSTNPPPDSPLWDEWCDFITEIEALCFKE